MSVPDIVIETRGLTKQYGSVRALRRSGPACACRIDLRLPRPQRRRQDHDDQALMGMVSADARRGPVLGRPIGDGAEAIALRRRTRTSARIARRGRG